MQAAVGGSGAPSEGGGAGAPGALSALAGDGTGGARARPGEEGCSSAGEGKWFARTVGAWRHGGALGSGRSV